MASDIETTFMFASQSAKRRSHAERLAELREAIDVMIEGATTDAGDDLLIEQLGAAHEAASMQLNPPPAKDGTTHE